MSLKIYLLGQFKLTSNDLPLELPSRPAQSTLAYLALNPGASLRREKLASLLWPEATEPNARAYLRQALWRIRKAFDSASLNWQDFLLSGDISVSFSDTADCWLDANALTAPQPGASADDLVTTVELYKGELLPGFYDDWVLPERDRLQAAFHQKMNQLLEALLLSSRWNEALIWSERWIQLGQAPEPAFRALMRAHAGLGDQAMVSAAYQRCRQTLQRDLGLDPSPETRRLYEQILQGELESPPAEPTRASQPVPQPPPFLQEDHPERVERAPFVAREQELDKLDTFLNLALDNQGRVVFVTGEAGSGKTALIGEFARRAQEKHPDLVVASGNCNAQTGIGDPYLPFREVLELLCGDVEARWAAGALTREHARRLWNTLPLTARALVEHSPDLVGTFVHSNSLAQRAQVCFPAGETTLQRLQDMTDRHAFHADSYSSLQSDLFEQYTRIVQTLTEKLPLLIPLDDLQWADSGSINLLFHLGRSLDGCRILVLGAYRPEELDLGRDGERHPLEPVLNEFQRLWGDITTNLDVVEGWEFVSALLANEPNKLDDVFGLKLHEFTRGHPLFTIELLRGMQERGDLIQDREGYWIEGPHLDWETIPARVEAVIAERIKRLEAHLQSTLQCACIEGETFTAEVAARVLGIEESQMVRQLSSDLDRRHRLVQSRSVKRVGSSHVSKYSFRHFMCQKYLYDNLDEVERVYLHRDVGESLEQIYSGYPEEISTLAPQLARHYLEAGIIEKSIKYQQMAGEQAIKMSAYQEARAHLSRALEMLFSQPELEERKKQELELQISLGMAWIGFEGNACPQVAKIYNRARQLCSEVGTTTQMCQILGELSIIHYVTSEYQKSCDVSVEIIKLAEGINDRVIEILGTWLLSLPLICRGKYFEARKLLVRVIDFYQPDQHHKRLISLRGSDAGVSALAYDACTLWLLGYPDQAEAQSKKALSISRQLDHPFTRADVLCFAGCLFNSMRREPQAEMKYARELEDISLKKVQGWRGTGTGYIGEALGLMEDNKKAIQLLLEGLAVRNSTNIICYSTGLMCSLAKSLAATGQIEEGFKTLEKAFDFIERMDERIWEAEMERVKAEMLGMKGDARGAEASLKRAIATAKKQQAKSWELRATIDIARLWINQGKNEQARTALEDIYGWFTEGFETADLRNASALLDEMGGISSN